jgi:flavin-binding protein dodecin
MDEKMAKIKSADFTGYSDIGIEEAIQDALDKAGDYARVEVIETRGSQANGENREYQVTLTAFSE